MAPIITAPRYSKELHVISDLEHHHCAIVHWAQSIASLLSIFNHTPSWLKASKIHHPLQIILFIYFFASFYSLVVSVLYLACSSHPSFLDLYSLENLYRVYRQNLNYLPVPPLFFILFHMGMPRNLLKRNGIFLLSRLLFQESPRMASGLSY